MTDSLLFPVGNDWQLTTEFYEPRPLSKPEEHRNHVHGAWDIAVPVGTPIRAPEDGIGWWWIITDSLMHRDIPRSLAPFRHYRMAVFGRCYILEGKSGLTHVFAHGEITAQLEHNKKLKGLIYGFGKTFAVIGERKKVTRGSMIGESGNGGYSTGAHIHYELHESPWQRWEDRPDPAELYPLEWEEHQGDLSLRPEYGGRNWRKVLATYKELADG